MTYKQIEAAREFRMWFGQVILPLGVSAIQLMSNPYARDSLDKKIVNIKDYANGKLKRKES